MKPVASIAGAAVAAALLSGCMSSHPFHSSASVKIVTDPEGAIATSEYGSSCTTPCSLRLLLARGGAITISKEGYEDKTVHIDSYVSDERLARKSFSSGIAAADPDAFDIAGALIGLIDPRGPVSELDTYEVEVNLAQVGERKIFDDSDDGRIEIRQANGVEVRTISGGARLSALEEETADALN